MSETRDAVAAFLEEYPELEVTIEELVSLDGDGPWTFDDVSCDSGSFGELVSREFVASVEDGYRLVDRDATRAALQGEPLEKDETDDDGTGSAIGERTVADIRGSSDTLLDRLRAGIAGRVRGSADVNLPFAVAAVASFLLLIVLRTSTRDTVFRDGLVVFPGNDTYHYRHWVDQLLAASPGLVEFGAIADVLGSRATGEPFTYVIGWWLTRLVEGNPEASGAALALLPVLSAVIVGLLVCWMAMAVTADERVAVLSVVALAITPGHALYTGVGFADHHALDYVWLTAMAAALVWLARDRQRRGGDDHLQRPGTWLVAAGFGVACVAAMMSWNGAPLLLLGVATYGAVRPVSQIRTDVPVLRTSLPLVAGLAIATLLGHLLHTGAGWQEPAVVYAPGVVLAGVVSIAVVGELVDRYGGTPSWAIGGVAVAGLGTLVGARVLTPGLVSRYTSRLTSGLLGRDSDTAIEAGSLLTPELGLSFGPIRYYGLLLVFAVPALAVVTRRCVRHHDARWVVVLSYAWPLFGLVLLQARFAGELAPFSSLLFGVGFIWLCSRLDLCRPLACLDRGSDHERVSLRFWEHSPDPSRLVYLSFALVLVIAAGIVITPAVVGTTTIDDAQYEAAAWIADDHDGDGGYVLSTWGRNRMYNYLAWGGGDTYGYARSTYGPFLASEQPDEWYNRLTTDAPQRVEYVVMDEWRIGGSFPREAWMNAVGQFQLAFVQGDRISVFRTVEGATIQGQATPGATVRVSTDVSVRGREYTYTREATAGDDGSFSVRVAYPGTYQLSDGTTVDVSESDVRDGTTVNSGVGDGS